MMRQLAAWLIVGLGLVALVLLYWQPPPAARFGLLAYLFLTAVVASLFLLARRQRRRWQGTRLRTVQTELEHLEKEYLALQRHRNALVQGLDLPFFLCQANSNLVMANEVALRWFEFRQVSGRSLLALTFSYDLYLLLQQCVKKRAQVSAEIQLIFPAERRVRATIWPLPSPSGGDLLYAVTLSDQTALYRLEQVRRDFVANVSHEFRTPLASVRALAETMLNDPQMSHETRARFLEMIVKETERLTRTADDLLVLSQAESQPPRKEPADLASIARSVLEQLQGEAQSAQVALHDELPPTLPLRANRDQMVQVVLNLLDNAIKYNQPGGHVYVRGSTQEGEVWLEIEDTGIGILSEDLPRIFERFYRVDKARSRDFGGTGLGLAIVKHIVESHGGRVEVHSEYHQGSRFRVYLPAG